jgi:hypothetical protein
METASATNLTEKQLFINMALSAWNSQNSRVGKLLETLTNDQIMAETAPGRNRGIYLIGHLIAVSDGMLPLLGLGPKLFPQLEKLYLTSPDDRAAETLSLSQLKEYWQIINNTLTNHFNAMKADDWFTRHTSVSAEDFAKEPHRNKLNLLINRTNHTSYHLGQLVYLVKK